MLNDEQVRSQVEWLLCRLLKLGYLKQIRYDNGKGFSLVFTDTGEGKIRLIKGVATLSGVTPNKKMLIAPIPDEVEKTQIWRDFVTEIEEPRRNLTPFETCYLYTVFVHCY